LFDVSLGLELLQFEVEALRFRGDRFVFPLRRRHVGNLADVEHAPGAIAEVERPPHAGVEEAEALLRDIQPRHRVDRLAKEIVRHLAHPFAERERIDACRFALQPANAAVEQRVIDTDQRGEGIETQNILCKEIEIVGAADRSLGADGRKITDAVPLQRCGGIERGRRQSACTSGA
jgi:hypothetical protein